MTLAENIALPLKEYTTLTKQEIDELCELKLSLVGLGGFGNYYPSEISGGMQKRAGLARAMALDPEILFFDEPSAGLDPISSRRLDDLIQELSASLGSTIVIVTHELASIMAIATDSIFLDAVEKTITAVGNPRELLHNSTNPRVREFLSRGEEKA
ncbi:MAG: ATP-binding cassette domain-containing protein [Victivallales bacterium]|nr:ATP-binding cassette domain-containing protein [Victivallales bacterium]